MPGGKAKRKLNKAELKARAAKKVRRASGIALVAAAAAADVSRAAGPVGGTADRAALRERKTRVEQLEAARGERTAGAVVTKLQAFCALLPLLLYNHRDVCLLPLTLDSEKDRFACGMLISGLAEKTVKRVWLSFHADGRIELEEPFRRGPDRLTMLQEFQIEDQVRSWVRTLLSDSDEPAWITRQNVKDKVRELTGYDLSFEYIGLLCHEWGLAFGRLETPPHEVAALRKLKRAIHVFTLNRFVAKGGYDVYDTDQSYIAVRDTHMMSFRPVDEPWGKFGSTRTRGAQGERLCFMHAVGPRGMAGDYETCAGIGDVTTDTPNCWMSFAALKKTGDYHGNFNYDTMMNWLNHRFFVWVKWAYPGIEGPGYAGRKVALTLDNASYQCTTSEDLTVGQERFNPLKLPMAKLVTCMRAVGCNELTMPFVHLNDDGDTIDDYTVILDDAAKTWRGKQAVCPTVAHIKAAAFKWLVENNEPVLDNDIERATRNMFGDNVVILYNAPAWPKRMRIEFCWGVAKGWTRFRRTKNRNVTELDEQVKESLYTNNFCAPGTNQFRGGFYVADAEGNCPAVEALTRHCWYSSEPRADGNVQSVIQLDETLSVSGEAGEPPCLDNLVVPEAYANAVNARGRNVANWYVAQMARDIFTGGWADALDRADDADGDDEEEED